MNLGDITHWPGHRNFHGKVVEFPVRRAFIRWMMTDDMELVRRYGPHSGWGGLQSDSNPPAVRERLSKKPQKKVNEVLDMADMIWYAFDPDSLLSGFPAGLRP